VGVRVVCVGSRRRSGSGERASRRRLSLRTPAVAGFSDNEMPHAHRSHDDDDDDDDCSDAGVDLGGGVTSHPRPLARNFYKA